MPINIWLLISPIRNAVNALVMMPLGSDVLKRDIRESMAMTLSLVRISVVLRNMDL